MRVYPPFLIVQYNIYAKGFLEVPGNDVIYVKLIIYRLAASIYFKRLCLFMPPDDYIIIVVALLSIVIDDRKKQKQDNGLYSDRITYLKPSERLLNKLINIFFLLPPLFSFFLYFLRIEIQLHFEQLQRLTNSYYWTIIPLC